MQKGHFSFTSEKCEPQYGFLILNRLSADNWVQPINLELDSQIQPPFLLYKNKDSEIYGIWFYEEDKCRLVGKAIEKYAKLAEEKSSNGRRPDTGKMDLTSLLNKAASSSSSDKKYISLPNKSENYYRSLIFSSQVSLKKHQRKSIWR